MNLVSALLSVKKGKCKLYVLNSSTFDMFVNIRLRLFEGGERRHGEGDGALHACLFGRFR